MEDSEVLECIVCKRSLDNPSPNNCVECSRCKKCCHAICSGLNSYAVRFVQEYEEMGVRWFCLQCRTLDKQTHTGRPRLRCSKNGETLENNINYEIDGQEKTDTRVPENCPGVIKLNITGKHILRERTDSSDFSDKDVPLNLSNSASNNVGQHVPNQIIKSNEVPQNSSIKTEEVSGSEEDVNITDCEESERESIDGCKSPPEVNTAKRKELKRKCSPNQMPIYEEMQQYEVDPPGYPFHYPVDEDDIGSESSYQQAPQYYNLVSALPASENPTAANKQSSLFFHDREPATDNAWAQQHPCTWEKHSVVRWLFHVSKCKDLSYEDVVQRFHDFPGDQLCSMSKFDYVHRDPVNGEIIYNALQEVLATKGQAPATEHRDEHYKQPYKTTAGRKPGKLGTEKRNSKLWEFIRDLLLDPTYCPNLLKWENRDEGVFRFVRSDEIAKLWGRRKNNTGMTYEKLSRAMRYHYKSGYLEAVLGKRLVYKFGKNATGWRLEDEAR